MGTFKLTTTTTESFTLIPNIFIDHYMPSANGSFVKVYLFLLRHLNTATSSDISLEQMADILENTESDLLRAIRYWTKEGILASTFDQNQTLISVQLIPLADSLSAPTATEEDSTFSSVVTPMQKEKAPTVLPERHQYTPVQMEALQEDQDIKEALTILETMLGSVIPRQHLDLILYLMTDLGFSVDLITYLYELSLGKNKRSPRYIEAVALAWASKGIKTVKEAEIEASGFNTKYNIVSSTFGLTRPLAPPERTIIDGWDQYHFSETIIVEACKRTILQTGDANLPYTAKILHDWHRQGVLTMADVEKCDKNFQKNRQTTKSYPTKNNQFQNFPQRAYSDQEYESLEQQLLQKQN